MSEASPGDLVIEADANVSEQPSPNGAMPKVRWTKDSVEHARTLHLALITVAAGLILLVTSAKSYRPQALVQMTEIVGLKQHWSPDWIWQHRIWRNDVSLDSSDLDRSALPEIAPNVEWYSVVNLAPRMVLTVYRSDTKKLERDTQLTVIMPEGVWLIDSPSAGLRQMGDETLAYDPVSLDSFPENMDQFRKWWAALQTGRTILHPDQLSGLCTMVDDSKRVVVKLDAIGSDEYHGTVHALRSLSVKVNVDSFAPLGDAVSYQGYDPLSNLTLAMPLVSSRSFQLNQTLVGSFFHWPTGSYETSFPDLIKATKGLEYMPLEDLQKRLASDADKGPETFELLGVKLPAEQITTAGILLLLAMQLYLLLCFRQRSTAVPADDPVWNVPWIGMEYSRLGRLTFFLSLVLATAAVAALGTNAILHLSKDDSIGAANVSDGRQFPTENRGLFWGEAGLFLSATAVSLFFSLASWNNRPKVSTVGATTGNPVPSTNDERKSV